MMVFSENDDVLYEAQNFVHKIYVGLSLFPREIFVSI